MKITSVTFDLSARDLESCPQGDLPEFALIGRSNVGKSSLLNLLVGQKKAARVSATPGHTKTMNFFTINEAWRLVDLPGYGYAKVARENDETFGGAFADYLVHRTNLVRVLALIDARHAPQAIDLEFIHWLAESAVPFVLVFTKSDKLKAKPMRENIELFQKGIAAWCQPIPEIFICSSETSQGLPELREFIRKTVASIE